ncbi:MarR family transcriptional regulator [soil metagenome]
MATTSIDSFCIATRRSPGYLIRRLHQLLLPRAEAVFADEHLTLSQWIALKLIRDGIADTSVALARALGHNSGATTRLIDHVEQRGWVTRHRRSDDRRVVTLELTQAGAAAVATKGPQMQALWAGLLADFTDAEVATLISLMGRLVDRMEEDGGG